MNTSLTAVLVSACLLAAVWVGIWLRRFLPPAHLSPDSRDTVKLAMGLVATMSALLLGLLVNSAKSSFDTRRGQVIQMASKFALLDRMLGIYGPEAAEVRRESRTLIEEQMRRLWPGEVTLPAQLKSDAPTGDAFYVAIQGLSPRDNAQRALKAQAVALAVELAQHRSLMLAQSISPFRRRCWSYLRIAIAVPELLQERLLSPLPFHHSKLASLSCGTRHEDVG